MYWGAKIVSYPGLDYLLFQMLLDFSDCLYSPQFYLTCCQLPFSYQILNTKQTVSAKFLWMLSFLDSRLFSNIETMPSFVNPRVFKGLFDTKRLMKRPKICKEIMTLHPNYRFENFAIYNELCFSWPSLVHTYLQSSGFVLSSCMLQQKRIRFC